MVPSFDAINSDSLQSRYKSPSFYCKGYNMNLTVVANECDIALYVCLLKGKFDNNLTWPFPGTVIIELLNQLEDKNHYQHRLTFPPEEKVGQRVINDSNNNEG